LLQKDQD